MLNLLFSAEEELFNDNEENAYSKKERVWLFVFIARILDLEEYEIDPKKCYEGCLYMLRNQEILDVLFKNKNETKTSQFIQIEKSKFMIKLIRSCRSYLSTSQITQLLTYSIEL